MSASGENGRIQILLVEDSEDDAFFFQTALEGTGVPCDLTHLVDGSQAVDYLEVIRTRKEGASPIPDLIFLDLKMPVLNGFEVLQWIASQNFHPSLRIAVLSGSDHSRDVHLARELGASEYLVKPLSSEELKKRLVLVASSDGGSERLNLQSIAASP